MLHADDRKVGAKFQVAAWSVAPQKGIAFAWMLPLKEKHVRVALKNWISGIFSILKRPSIDVEISSIYIFFSDATQETRTIYKH